MLIIVFFFVLFYLKFDSVVLLFYLTGWIWFRLRSSFIIFFLQDEYDLIYQAVYDHLQATSENVYYNQWWKNNEHDDDDEEDDDDESHL